MLGENGVAFGTDGSTILAFDLNTGAVNWTYQPTDGSIAIVAAAADGKLVAKVSGDEGETVVRFDASGAPTFDSWTASSLDYVFGDMWLAQGSTELRSALAILWPWSIWPKPRAGDTLAAIGPVEISVSKVTEAQVNDDLIRDRVNGGIHYWQERAGILLKWNGIITGVPACDLARHPDCVVDQWHSNAFDITDVTDAPAKNTLAEVLGRYPQSAKGIHLLFTEYLKNNAHGYTHPATSPNVKPNLILLKKEPADVVPHELGHVFGLQHIGFAPLNLMCGPEGDFWDELVAFGCSISPFTTGLDDDTQIPVARRNAATMR